MARHHLVPQMYLRLFADPSNKLTMVNRADLDHQLTVTVNNACNQAGFYTIPTSDIAPHARDGHDPDALESTLATIEGATVPVIERIITTHTVPGPDEVVLRNGLVAPWDRYQLALFVALQMTRTWAFRRELDELIAYWGQRRKEAFTTDERVAAYLAGLGEGTSPQDIQQFRERALGPDGPQLAVGASRSLQAAMQHAIENTHPEILLRRWHLRVFDDPILLTSDAPVVLHRAGSPGTPIPGVVNADAIYWPVGRRHLLSFERRTPQEGFTPDKITLSAAPARARIVNGLVAGRAEKWIFHHPADRPLEGLTLASRPELAEEVDRVIEASNEVRVRNRVFRR